MTEKQFAEKFTKLDDVLRDASGEFSGSQMFDDLSALEEAALAFGENSSQLAFLYDDLSLLQSKRWEWEEAISFGEKAIEIHKQISCFSGERIFLLHYRLSKGHEEEGNAESALQCLKFCVDRIDSPWLDARQRLAMKQDFGKLLHDLKFYQQALDSNLSCYKEACALLGENDSDADGLLNNIVQNLYELKKMDEAETWLHRRLKLAEVTGSYDAEADTLFQLGVLKYEQGQVDVAFKLFDQRLKRAKELDMEHLIDGAQEAIAELKNRSSKV